MTPSRQVHLELSNGLSSTAVASDMTEILDSITFIQSQHRRHVHHELSNGLSSTVVSDMIRAVLVMPQ